MNSAVRALSVVAASVVCIATADAADKVRFQTDWLPSGEHAMYYGGWQKGIFAEEGIDVTITRGYGSGDTLTKLAGGAFDFGVADVAAVLAARARQNVPVKTIAALYGQSPHSLFVLKSSGITNFKGLEGKKISITPGNSHKFYFPKVAEKSGTDPNKIVWVNMDAGAMAAQLIAKNIDAAPFYSIHHYYINKAAKAAGEEIIPLPFVEVGLQDLCGLDHRNRQNDFREARSYEALPARDQALVRVGARQPGRGLQTACPEGAGGRARRLREQREGRDDVRLHRSREAVRLGQYFAGAARDHVAGDRGSPGSRCEVGSEQGVRHVSSSGQVIRARC